VWFGPKRAVDREPRGDFGVEGLGEGAKKYLTFGAESSILIGVDRNTISSPIEQGRHNTGQGRPSAILHTGSPLTARQQTLLYQLPEYDSRVTVKKNDVSMKDLSALTAKTGVEFATFTKGQERLIVRGNEKRVNITTDDAEKLSADGYKWSGHTHVGLYNGWELSASNGDYDVLSKFSQKESVIYNAKGEYQTFKNILRKGPVGE
jgi:hypothetical protein